MTREDDEEEYDAMFNDPIPKRYEHASDDADADVGRPIRGWTLVAFVVGTVVVCVGWFWFLIAFGFRIV